ncbi:MAG: phosphoribosylformylglycinamidine cyclo-ligase [Clostridiales bacterium]|jgi:phosphoribosylformylglycinamidine cyclo-ligase|nr:phosphoribosylformylglycinamidine cyclo-ligase [Clostridiales bacterium]
MSQAYRMSGVDVEAGYKSVELIRKQALATFRNEVLSDLGGFGGLFSLAAAKKMDDPVLVSGTDGVGTKLKVAFLMDKHDTVGIDCVAMCVNDIVCYGAEPLFFLDYISCGRNYPQKIETIVKGVSKGCQLAKTALIGGETAEMPGFYSDGDYDLVGFAVGLIDKAKCIDGKSVKAGDALIGLGSSGVHSNGFSLIRRVLRLNEQSLKEYVQALGSTLGDELIKPTRIYVQTILKLKEIIPVKAICHITGGGFFENIPRMLPEGIGAVIRRGSWNELPIFKLIKWEGEIPDNEMFNVFNMGIGMVMAVAPEHADTALAALKDMGEKAYVIGEACEGASVNIC